MGQQKKYNHIQYSPQVGANLEPLLFNMYLMHDFRLESEDVGQGE